MQLLDRILGRNITMDAPAAPTADEQAVERYEYLLRTAKPDTIESAHVDAFEQLTPEQRDLVFERFTAHLPTRERPDDATPVALAKTATRAEERSPGILARAFGKSQADAGKERSGPEGGSFLGTFAAYAIASSAIDAIFWAGLIGTTAVASNADNSEEGSDVPEATASDDGAGFFGIFDF